MYLKRQYKIEFCQKAVRCVFSKNKVFRVYFVTETFQNIELLVLKVPGVPKVLELHYNFFISQLRTMKL